MVSRLAKSQLCTEADELDRKRSIDREDVLMNIKLKDLNLVQILPNASPRHKRRVLDPGHFLGHETHLSWGIKYVETLCWIGPSRRRGAGLMDTMKRLFIRLARKPQYGSCRDIT